MTERDRPWWTETTIYQIYPRSFFDSNGDGIGDIPGILEKLDYVQELGFETIWLSPHYASPQRDFGYDISDYRAIAPEYGTLEDTRRLIDEVHRRGMKIVFDMILNHTSDQHPWFVESRSSRTNPKRDWYIWRDGQGGKPPTNWSAIPGGSAWTYDEVTDQWFLHNFLDCQPDLNFRNPEVKRAMFDVLRYWLDRGVDGYRLDIFHSVFKDAHFRDNPRSWRLVPTADFDEGFFQKLKYNLNRPEAYALAKEIRALVDEYSPDRFVVGEVFGKEVDRYLGEDLDGLHLILQFDLVYLHEVTAEKIRDILIRMEEDYPPPATPTYALGNHDRRRYMSRIGHDPSIARLLAVFQYTARGVAITYYGDELGIPDGEFPHRHALDPTAKDYWWLPVPIARRLGIYANRDGCRTPMQWSDAPNAGFCPPGVRPWLPVHEDFPRCNVAVQERDERSLLETHRSLLRIRRERAPLRRGAVQIHTEGVPASVVAYSRHYEGETITVAMNFGPERVTIEGLGTERRGNVLFRTDTLCGFDAKGLRLGPYGAALLDATSG